MAAVCRPARLEDLQPADALVAHSINDLTERHGFGPMVSPRPPRFQQFCLEDDPDGLWVAEDEGQIVGFGFSWVCDDLWFLAQLFVSPGQQGSGLGNELLKRTLHQAEKEDQLTGRSSPSPSTGCRKGSTSGTDYFHGFPSISFPHPARRCVAVWEAHSFVASQLRRVLRACATSKRSMLRCWEPRARSTMGS